MSLISRLGRRFREKPKSTNLNLPSLPSPREILEDIESCHSRDPIISFANLIKKKGKQSLLDSDFLENNYQSTQESHLGFLSPYQTGSSSSSTVEDSQASGRKSTHVKAKGSSSSPQVAAGNSGSSKRKPSEMDQINSYDQLKQFLLLYEKSEELLDDIEPHFKRIDSTVRACEAYSNPNHEDVESYKELEYDVCSSPLL